MADYSDFDIDRSTAQAWAEFQARLGEVISVIDDSGDLSISAEAAGDVAVPLVSVGSPERDLVRAEAVANAVLPPEFQLTADQLDTMERLGWQAPSTSGPRPAAGFWCEVAQDRSEHLAELVVGALRDVFGIQHPVFLAPDQLAEILQPPPPPLSGVASEPSGPGSHPDGTGLQVNGSGAAGDGTGSAQDSRATVPGSQEHLNDLVDDELTAMFGHRPIRDREGDIAIRVGSTMLFLRTAADGREIVVFSAVVHDVDGRSRAAEVLNDLNVAARWVKFQLIRDRVFVTLSLPARPFVPAHLRQAVQIMSDVADGIDDELATKLRGRTTFSQHDHHDGGGEPDGPPPTG